MGVSAIERSGVAGSGSEVALRGRSCCAGVILYMQRREMASRQPSAMLPMIFFQLNRLRCTSPTTHQHFLAHIGGDVPWIFVEGSHPPVLLGENPSWAVRPFNAVVKKSDTTFG
ncbi:MAG: hypothetical protein HWN65_14415 [Candidatus Helarchaeota archaeon]|nr:hypothetical protein [Candidatus Helarchaeota archaeon]